MDNYNNQNTYTGQQYQPSYGAGMNQGQQYQQPLYGGGMNQGQQYQPSYGVGMNQGQQYQQYSYGTVDMTGTIEKKGLSRIFTLSMILGIVGSVIMLVGLMMPAIDFSHFHQEVDIQYNLFKIGKNVGLISAMWNVIPYAILVSVVVMVILSFVRIPILKLLPTILILCMLVLMLVDMGNVAAWATDMLDKVGIVLEKEITIKEIFKSLMPGIYVIVVGWVVALVSCFVKIKE